MKNYIKLFCIILFFSCESEPPLSESVQARLDRAEIQLSIDSETFKLSVYTNNNFADASFLQFKIVFNHSIFSIEGYEVGDCGNCNKVWSNLDDANLEKTSGEFIFNSVSSSMHLVTIDFAEPTGSYEGKGFYLDDIMIKDEALNSIYYSCTIPEYVDPFQCRNAGGQWGVLSGEFYPRNVCYIDEEVETMNLDGVFQWAHHYCD